MQSIVDTEANLIVIIITMPTFAREFILFFAILFPQPQWEHACFYQHPVSSIITAID